MYFLRANKQCINDDYRNGKKYFDQLLYLMRYQKEVDVSIGWYRFMDIIH